MFKFNNSQVAKLNSRENLLPWGIQIIRSSELLNITNYRSHFTHGDMHEI